MVRKKIEGEEGLASFVREFAQTLKPQDKAFVLALYGELGAGKTTFVQKLAEYFDIREPIRSPTFVIEKMYPIEHKGFSHLIHIDAYRLEGEEELRELGIEEVLADPANLVVIEWAEKVEELLPEESIDIYMEHAGGEKREIVIKLKS